jgi:hypothetical protein
MEQVKRYGVIPYSGFWNDERFGERNDGNYVLYSDYAALQSELDAARENLKTAMVGHFAADQRVADLEVELAQANDKLATLAGLQCPGDCIYQSATHDGEGCEKCNRNPRLRDEYDFIPAATTKKEG